MSICDDWIEQLEKELPEKCRVEDLINEGIYRSPQAASNARKTGKSPPYFQLGRRIMYPRAGVIQWLKENKHENNQSNLYAEKTQPDTSLQIQSGMENSSRAPALF